MDVTRTEKVEITSNGGDSVETGKTLTLTASNNLHADDTFTWTSSNVEVATVDNGVVTAVKEGKTTITATSVTSPSISGTFEVTVKAPIAGTQTVITFGDDNVTEKTDAKYTWKVDKVTVTQEQNSGDNAVAYAGPMRVYRNHIVTVSISEGTMTSVTFHWDTKSTPADLAKWLKTAGFDATVDGKNITVTGEFTTVNFTALAQIRFIGVTVVSK